MSSPRARQLRKNPTDAELRLWSRLRNKQLAGYGFRRQAPIGPYIVDFACFSEKLVVEIDGGQHALTSTDQSRTRWLQGQGFQVLRFWNQDVLGNAEGVVEKILEILGSAP